MRFFAVIAFLSVAISAAAAEDAPFYEPMTPFADLAGKAWRGEGNGPDGKPIVDVVVYEMILGGRALQATHRLEDGSYGGRTIIFYDESAKEYIFHYFTTAGFHTIGKIVPMETGFTAVENVEGHPDVAQVRSEMFYDNDTLRVVSRHVTHDGKMSAEETRAYVEIDDPGDLFSDKGE